VVHVANIATFLWLGLWAIRAAKALAAGERHTILFAILLHFVLAGVPVFLDVAVGQPEYVMRGLYYCTRDDLAACIYCLYVSAVPLIWWFTGRGRRDPDQAERQGYTGRTAASLERLRPLLYLFLCLPIAVALITPHPGVYLEYGAAGTEGAITRTASHALISLASVLCVIGAAGILASEARIRARTCLFLAPWLFLAIWCNGKRYIIAYALVLIGYLFWEKGYLRSRRIIAGGVAMVAGLVLFSYVYLVSIRGIRNEVARKDRVYQTLRLDYGRDAEIKMAIFGELHPEALQILDHRGQSVLFDLTMYVPRALWSAKPLPYAQYMTSAAMLVPARNNLFSLTTSWLEEAIANFGWWGMLIGPLTLSFLCRIGDGCEDGFVGALTALISCLFLSVEFVSFAPIFFLWVFLVIRTHRMRVSLTDAPSIALKEPLSAAPLAGSSS
jgi:hypothetical protein